MQIRTKRIYDPVEDADGRRILIDRIWPRGVSKQQAAIDYWAKDCAPSTELRKWYSHDPEKWQDFCRRYFSELDTRPEAVRELKQQLDSGTVTLLFASRETELNNAAALKAYLSRKR